MPFDIGERGLAVNGGLALTQEIEVGTVKDEDGDRHYRIVPPDPSRSQGRRALIGDSVGQAKGRLA
jgi:hypothetical protein